MPKSVGSRFAPQKSIKGKLFRYMLSLAAVLLFAALASLFLFGRFSSKTVQLSETLRLQMDVFTRGITGGSEENAVTGIYLSERTSETVEEFLAGEGLSFSGISNNPGALARLQERLLPQLEQYMMQASCSGAFILLDATVNTSIPDADRFRSGLYLQKGDAADQDGSVLLYRGSAEIGKAAGVMPHRKWRLEFRTDLFPGTPDLLAPAGIPLERAYRYTEAFTLPGTSEQAVLMVLPVRGGDGTFYGLCGFELSQSYFQMKAAQPTTLPYLTCLAAPEKNGIIRSDRGFSCGIAGGYYLAPRGDLTAKPIRHGLSVVTGSTIPYVGLLKTVVPTPSGEPVTLAVLVPKSYYDSGRLESGLETGLLIVLILFFAVSCCIFFSRRFLTPLLQGLEQLRSRKSEGSTGYQEIDDLFGFLEEKDREHESELHSMLEKTQSAESRAAAAQTEYQKARAEIDRLAYSRKDEVDPDEYRAFLDGIRRLTPTEHEIFGYYLAGKTVPEIMEIAGIKESTLRYHNRNIYGKLGVNSLRQLLRYAALMHWQENQTGSGKEPAHPLE